MMAAQLVTFFISIMRLAPQTSSRWSAAMRQPCGDSTAALTEDGAEPESLPLGLAGQLQAYQQQGDPASWATCQRST
jgi:hypothetical protein